MFRERGWMTEMSVMEMPWRRARRISLRALGRMAEPAEVPAPAARPGCRRRGGSRVEAMPARCTARRKIPFRMSWRSVKCAARAEHRMPWSVPVRWRVAPQPHCTVGALRGRMVRPRRCWRAVWNSPLLSSRALESGRVSSQADAGRQAQLRSRTRARLPSSVPSCKEASKASARARAECRQ
jgi:hypothetical protein